MYRGGILGGNPDRSLKSFPPCYSQTPLLTDCTPHLLFFGLEISTSNSWGGKGGGFWVNKYTDLKKSKLIPAN
jgi:hypothetical protein